MPLDYFLGGGTLKYMNKRAYGFTVVELLIVVVVIAVLAAITIVTYNNVSHRARVSKVMATAKQVGQKVMVHQAEYGELPTSLEDVGVAGSQGDVLLAYTVSSSEAWCVTASADGNVRYGIGSATGGAVVEGACAMAGVVATVTATAAAPTVMNGVRTVVFVGREAGAGGQYRYVFDLRPTENRWLYLQLDGSVLCHSVNMCRRESGIMEAYVITASPSSVYVGQRYSSTETWRGSFTAAGFDRVLTAAEAEQVISELRANL